ncbi:glycoside hydrolase family 76 protein [Cucurbitaria berberidis CBS 394.84]|uniref:mannan endo-1,6-alpha-mannosidase n=1 Tax=Cucurbitaria berberidis CBS 394.84 TaxID=1168544 RepID=A0A9P4L8S5_9PLEO|nr:glycoside hydrolase family 76 protein [Cucurbitaria berberidis CBS 394.84]KAF1846365.1 glycoside hydrolase family 76 protein [Cucurbitaria berberidis CBS 394.84]
MRISSVLATGLSTCLFSAPFVVAEPPSVESLLTSAAKFAASLKSTYPNPSIALLPRPFWWWQSGIAIDALLTYSQTTGDKQYYALLQNTIISQKTGTNDFMTRDAEGNDDQAWWALAALSAAENGVPNVGNVTWLDLARNVYNEQKARYDPSTCGGGIRWKVLEGNGKDGWHYKNSISNGLFFQLAARLARFTGDADAQAWAERVYDWVVSVKLIGENFEVYDGTDDTNGTCTELNRDQWSYNNGVFLHGSAVMAALTKNAKWLDRTNGFIASAKRTFTQNGTLFEQKCEASATCNTDQVSFKGILARWLGASALILPELRADIADVISGTVTAVQRGNATGLGVMDSFIGLEVVDASLRTQGIGGVEGVIGLYKGTNRVRRSIAGRIRI